MLNSTQLEAREGKLTASRVACLMTGDTDRILNLWREMVGDPDYVAEDFTWHLPVQMGEATEPVNIRFYQRNQATTVSRRGEVVTGPEAWMAATLDGWDDVLGCPVECKTVGGFELIDEIIKRYQPQMQWQMLVTQTQQCALSVIFGTSKQVVEIIPLDMVYATELQRRGLQFMECVWSLTPPVAFAPIAVPVKPVKTYDMTGDNLWASEAHVWLEHRAAARSFQAAEKELKGLVPLDAIRCHGHNIEAKRDRAGRLSLKEMRA